VADLATARAAEMLQAILHDFAERSINPTPLAVICAATDAGADDELAASVANLFNKKTQEA
jgi:hypothetical protein